eukprot:CAMPEP_0168736916 /NCGR_PEP_ID=MMETSP0724-20121128/10111_1 /TAXON_ID=265536 /ORGANISM="Amphiprora sp., Strain CCMP467" /LENGTH=630 /DNA_ID=CAMNT_0008784137 /DNA_START=168 /DNA_END=2056 /DNA_ORIENTATION=-
MAGSSSSASTHLEAVGTPVGKRPRSDRFFLAIRTQPPAFVFPGEKFSFEFAVEGGSSSTASPPTDVDVAASLSSISPEVSNKDCMLEIMEPPRISPSRRTGTIKCLVKNPRVSRKHGCSFQINLRVTGDGDIAPCNTRTISLVNAKLNVHMNSDWTHVWFKDEGGRDKCMEGDVTLWNDRNEKLWENVILDLTLCYAGEDNVTVSNQELLRRIGTDQQFQIDRSSGSGKIRFRVEDVSKNHQGQNFVVKISAAKGSIRDIASVFTPPVSVRSKRNKPKPKVIAGARQSSIMDHSSDRSSIDPRPTSSFGGPRVFEGADPMRVRNAVQSIVRWADEVVRSLYNMQWHVIGYEHRPDGSVDVNRPLHKNIQNPNPSIDHVLTMYNETVRENLGFLQVAVGQTGGQSVAAAGGASPYGTQNVEQPVPLGGPSHTSQPYSAGMQPFPQATPRYSGDYYHPYHYPVAPVPPQQQQPMLPHTPYQQQYFYGHEQQPLPAAKESPHEQSPIADDRKVASSIHRESEVEFVLAKAYKSVRTGERLGFPAFSADHEILGFYRESTTKVGTSNFDPIIPHDFDSAEKDEAKSILEAAIESKSNAVHALKDWGSMARLLDHCIIYNFTKDIDDTTVGDTNR